MKVVKAEEEMTYSVICPHCEETNYSELNDGWDIYEMVHADQEIKCAECDAKFMVSI